MLGVFGEVSCPRYPVSIYRGEKAFKVLVVESVLILTVIVAEEGLDVSQHVPYVCVFERLGERPRDEQVDDEGKGKTVVQNIRSTRRTHFLLGRT